MNKIYWILTDRLKTDIDTGRKRLRKEIEDKDTNEKVSSKFGIRNKKI